MTILVPNRESRSTLVLLVLGSAIGMAGAFTVLFGASFGMFAKPISADLGWTRTQVALLPSASFLGFALGAPVMGWLTDQVGPRLVLLLGILGVGLGLTGLAALPGSLFGFVAISFGMGFCGAATAATGYVLVLSRRINQRLGLAIALAMIGLGTAMVGIPLMAQAFIHNWGWRGAYFAFAGLAVSLGLLGLLLGTGQPGSIAKARRSASGGRTPTARDGVPLREAFAAWRFWLIGVAGLAIGAADFGGIVHIAASLSDHGLSAAAAARVTACTGAGLFAGRVGAGLLLDRIFAPLVGMGCCVAGGLGLLLIGILPVQPMQPLYAAAFLAGLPLGCEGDTIPFLVRRYFGLGSFGAIYGWAVGLAGLGAAAGPLLFGFCRDTTGSYALMFGIAGLLCAVSGMAFMTLGPYRHQLGEPVTQGSGRTEVMERHDPQNAAAAGAIEAAYATRGFDSRVSGANDANETIVTT